MMLTHTLINKCSYAYNYTLVYYKPQTIKWNANWKGSNKWLLELCAQIKRLFWFIKTWVLFFIIISIGYTVAVRRSSR